MWLLGVAAAQSPTWSLDLDDELVELRVLEDGRVAARSADRVLLVELPAEQLEAVGGAVQALGSWGSELHLCDAQGVLRVSDGERLRSEPCQALAFVDQEPALLSDGRLYYGEQQGALEADWIVGLDAGLGLGGAGSPELLLLAEEGSRSLGAGGELAELGAWNGALWWRLSDPLELHTEEAAWELGEGLRTALLVDLGQGAELVQAQEGRLWIGERGLDVHATSLAVGDVDGDGCQDLVVGGAGFLQAYAGCTEGVEDSASEDPDGDGDGFTVEDGDCDDDDGAIFPGAMEVCDSRDQDCNGAVDEGIGVWDVWTEIWPPELPTDFVEEPDWDTWSPHEGGKVHIGLKNCTAVSWSWDMDCWEATDFASCEFHGDEGWHWVEIASGGEVERLDFEVLNLHPAFLGTRVMCGSDLWGIQAEVGKEERLVLEAVDPGGDPYDFSLVGLVPDDAGVRLDGDLLRVEPTRAGSWTIELAVTDSQGAQQVISVPITASRGCGSSPSFGGGCCGFASLFGGFLAFASLRRKGLGLV